MVGSTAKAALQEKGVHPGTAKITAKEAAFSRKSLRLPAVQLLEAERRQRLKLAEGVRRDEGAMNAVEKEDVRADEEGSHG